MSDTGPVIDSLSQLTTRGKGEIKRWIETWLPRGLSAAGIAALGFIRFNSENTELALRWLHIYANASDDDDFGIQITSENNIRIEALDSGVFIGSNNYIRAAVWPSAAFEVENADEDVWFSVQGDGQRTDIYLSSGGTFTVHDSNGDPMLQMTEGFPDLHIPAGGTVVADL